MFIGQLLVKGAKISIVWTKKLETDIIMWFAVIDDGQQ